MNVLARDELGEVFQNIQESFLQKSLGTQASKNPNSNEIG